LAIALSVWPLYCLFGHCIVCLGIVLSVWPLYCLFGHCIVCLAIVLSVWPLYCLFFDLWLLITTLLSSNCSYIFQIFVFLVTYFTTRLTRRVQLVEQELFTFTEHLSSSPVFSGVHVTQCLVVCVFCRSLFVLFPFFIWPSYCLSFFDLRIFVSLLVSSNPRRVYKSRLYLMLQCLWWATNIRI